MLRVGVCSDTRRGLHTHNHLCNGEYYNIVISAENFTLGQTISLKLSVNAYHNVSGEFSVCDVFQCNSEVNGACLMKMWQNRTWRRWYRARRQCATTLRLYMCYQDTVLLQLSLIQRVRVDNGRVYDYDYFQHCVWSRHNLTRALRIISNVQPLNRIITEKKLT